ncbi:hypothetical protein J2X65_002055 [Ancylobacter sp. 3268]|uniref:hypothetical protein n=1 Tax=Ancylobacter sp. 3268 TaxID=2817752 RepID=UPI00285E29B3|nr:hypothetical protein [Ancylobacter sp. 3268]MDR6952696.1 hypothetical protein [Ancylobacter sp. 3268]
MAGEIELAPQRAVTHLIGHDAGGYFGRTSLASAINMAGFLPANVGDFPLRAGEHYGQVATNCRVPTNQATDGVSVFSHNRHTLRAEVSEIAVVIPNWFIFRTVDKAEHAIQSAYSVGVSIQYPVGSLTKFRFDGAFEGGMPSGGQICSDFISVSDLTHGAMTTLPAGTEFETRIVLYGGVGYINNLFRQNAFASLPEGSTVSGGTGTPANRVVDLTYRFPGNPSDPPPRAAGVWPMAIIARTTHGSVIGFTDSIGEGTGDSYTEDDVADLGFGVLGRSLAPHRAYIMASCAGASIGDYSASYDRKFSLLRYVKNAIFQLGINGMAGLTVEQNKAAMLKLWSLAVPYKVNPGTRFFQTTITPSCSSSNGFIDLGGQTVATGFEGGVRQAVNDWIRDGAPLIGGAPAETGLVGALRAGGEGHPLHGYFECADVWESGRNSGLWIYDPVANRWTLDGLHPTRAANIRMEESGAIDISMLA